MGENHRSAVKGVGGVVVVGGGKGLARPGRAGPDGKSWTGKRGGQSFP